MEHERIICVLEYLSRYSDENTYVCIKQIQDYDQVIRENLK